MSNGFKNDADEWIKKFFNIKIFFIYPKIDAGGLRKSKILIYLVLTPANIKKKSQPLWKIFY
jgi:hypothetical protein